MSKGAKDAKRKDISLRHNRRNQARGNAHTAGKMSITHVLGLFAKMATQFTTNALELTNYLIEPNAANEPRSDSK
jgi:hypothetical protein